MSISVSQYRSTADLLKNGFRKLSGSMKKTGEEVYKLQDGNKRVYAFVKRGKVLPRQINAYSSNSHTMGTGYKQEKLNWNTEFMGHKGNTTHTFYSTSDSKGLTVGRTLVQESPAGQSRISHSIVTDPHYKVSWSRFDKNIQQKPVTRAWNDVPSPVTLLEDQTIINRFDKGLSTQSSILTQNSVLKPIDVEQMPTFKSFGDTLKSEYLFYRN